jgi:hypothetical protein
VWSSRLICTRHRQTVEYNSNPSWCLNSDAFLSLFKNLIVFTSYFGLLFNLRSTINKVETGKFWLYKTALLYLQHLTHTRQRTCATILPSNCCVTSFDIHVLRLRIYSWKYYCMLCQRSFRNWTCGLIGTPSLSCIHCIHSVELYYTVHSNLSFSSSISSLYRQVQHKF